MLTKLLPWMLLVLVILTITAAACGSAPQATPTGTPAPTPTTGLAAAVSSAESNLPSQRQCERKRTPFAHSLALHPNLSPVQLHQPLGQGQA